MINVHEFARRLNAVGADEFTDDDIWDLATAGEVRISGDEIDATMAQRLLDQISPTPPEPGPRSRHCIGRRRSPLGRRHLRCLSPALAPATCRLTSRPDLAVHGLHVTAGGPAPDEPAGEIAASRFVQVHRCDDHMSRRIEPTRLCSL
ncbi:hypothetical protein [Actinoplanes sp. NPDC049265]|uniref:hypothetical protein n=1 Tax=Actinoplanes sp. NPDC049265 TaxID=3363902 RepID=UPI003720818B